MRCIGAVIATFGIGMYAGLNQIARVGDDRQRNIEQVVVGSAFRHLQGKLADTIAQNAYWDTAYDRVSSPLDPKWADAHLGAYSAQTADIPITMIFDAHGAPVYLFNNTTTHLATPALRRSVTVAKLVSAAAAARQLPPTASTGFVVIGRKLFLGAAQRIDDGRARAALARHYVMVYLSPLDGPGLAALPRMWMAARPAIFSHDMLP